MYVNTGGQIRSLFRKCCSTIRSAPRLRTQAHSLAVPVALLLVSLGIVAAVWAWLGSSITLARSPVDPAAKLDCVSYAPFRGGQSPFVSDLMIGPEQIVEDLAQLAEVTRCVRIYSVDNGLDRVPELASRFGLKVNLGVWIGRDRIKNMQLIERALSVADANANVVTSITVGSEVLLRGEMTAEDLRVIIRSVKARANIPVSYADVWEFWLRYRDIADDVDFVTIHILPYWEDHPVRAEHAAAHVDDVRKRVAAAFPGKDILIGETGWPSDGRMRDVALPSPINQARFISEILDRAARENFRINLFEAYDARWKRRWEGTVGGHWGLFDTWHRLKYPPGAAISDHPLWLLQLACGVIFCASVFGVALLALRRSGSRLKSGSWTAVAVTATAGGSLLGLAAEKMLSESYGLGDWLLRGVLLVAAIAAPLQSSHALMSGRALPTFLQLLGPREGKPLSQSTMSLGFTLIITTVIAAEIAMGLIFDPRWRDFPFADLTMVVVSFSTLTELNGPKVATRPLAEAVFAGLFAVAALYILFNEGFHNWQSLWTSAIYGLFGATLWQAPSIAVTPAIAPALPVVPAEMIVERADPRR
jgi:exo-beta-1,3-glucanase (GH17 family)